MVRDAYSFVNRHFKNYMDRQILSRIDIDTEDAPILAQTDPRENPPDERVSREYRDDTEITNIALPETMNYSPAIGNISSPISDQNNKDTTDIEHDNPEDDPLLQTEEDTEVIHPIAYTNGEHAPAAVVDYYNESTSNPDVSDDQVPKIFGFEVSMNKRTREQIVAEHLEMNSMFYNTLFYNSEYAREICLLKNFDFLTYFFPNFITHNFYSRLKSSLGGLGMDKELYHLLGIRYPLDTDFTHPLGAMNQEYDTDVRLYIDSSYSADCNWYRASTNQYDHVVYCLRLYSIMGEIMNNPHFRKEDLPADALEILTQWQSRVIDQFEKNESKQDLSAIQAMHDLFWNFTDNPMSENDAAVNLIAMCHNMACGSELVAAMTEGTEMLSKQDCTAYLIKELGLDDDLFLIPSCMEYPIINKQSVKLAMDMINRVEKEYPDQVQEYVKNLNRKYKELGCTFSISVDHPYAKYADKNIVMHMVHLLMEGDTAVADDGTSTNRPDRVTTEPWYKRLDYTGTVARNLLDNKELGPNDKKYPSPDYERTDAFL